MATHHHHHKDGDLEEELSPSKLRQMQDAAAHFVPNLDRETSEKSTGRSQSLIDRSPVSPSSEAAPNLMEEDEGSLLVKAFVIFLAVVVFPMICRTWYLDPPARCALVILSMLLFNLGQVMPLFCSALFVPVLGTLCAVLGDQRSVLDTSTLLVGNIFNNTSFMILGALVINGIFTKCGLERRFMKTLLAYFDLNGPWFLFALIMGGTLLCSVLYSGSMVLVIAVKSELKDGLRAKTVPANVAKRILLGSAICANAGAVLLPISSVLTLIAVSLLADFGYAVTTSSWLAISAPIVFSSMLGSWLLLLIAFPSGPSTSEPACSDLAREAPHHGTIYESDVHEEEDPGHIEITDWHLIFLGVGAFATIAITLYSAQLEPLIGHAACVSLLVVVIVFGSGFMSRDEFCSLDWDILALVGGTNVVALMVRETGLGLAIADAMTENQAVESLPFHGLLGVALSVVMVAASFLQHSITGVLTMPLLVAIGIKLQAAESLVILVAMAIPFGMALHYSSFDNMFSQRTSYELGTKRAWLTNRDWAIAGGWTAVIAWCVLMSIGYHICFTIFALPPPVWVVEHEIPKELVPQVVKENFKFKFLSEPVSHVALDGLVTNRTSPFSVASAIDGAAATAVLTRQSDDSSVFGSKHVYNTTSGHFLFLESENRSWEDQHQSKSEVLEPRQPPRRSERWRRKASLLASTMSLLPPSALEQQSPPASPAASSDEVGKNSAVEATLPHPKNLRQGS